MYFPTLYSMLMVTKLETETIIPLSLINYIQQKIYQLKIKCLFFRILNIILMLTGGILCLLDFRIKTYYTKLHKERLQQ